jgi:ribosomal protein S18 acetylase RimI-like enzyme
VAELGSGESAGLPGPRCHGNGAAMPSQPAPPAIRPATLADVPALHALVERCYRGSDNQGWTHEGALFDGPRSDVASLAAVLAAPGQVILVADGGDGPVASVQVSDAGHATAYLGLLCVDPRWQTGGLAKRMIAAAEALAVARYGATVMEMTVINHRPELLAYYQRRGYALTGEVRYLPPGLGQLRDDISLLVLARTLPPAA